MLISVALATYNGGRYLRAQLDSIAAQSLPPAELVVSDDGSEDDTLEIVTAFSKSAPFPVRLLPRDKRRGFADNFLHAAASCQHDVVAFCDQDDVWLPGKLETVSRRMAADDSLLVLHRLTTTDEALEPTGIWTQGIENDAVFAPLALDPYVNGWGNTMMFRRALVTEIPTEPRPRQPEKPERPLSHDTWIYVLAAALGRVSHVMEPLVLYRQHGANAIGVQQQDRPTQPPARQPLSMDKLRERMIFYNKMTTVFDQISQLRDHPFAAPARTAAEAYARRRDPLTRRLAIYDGPSFVARLAAFRAMNRTQAQPLKSRVKDLALGVAGLHALLG